MSSVEWHYHKQINVRIPLRLTVGVRAKQDDLLRPELARNLIAEFLDLSARRFFLGRFSASELHCLPLCLRSDYTLESREASRHAFI